MNLKNKKNYPYYIAIFILCLSILVVLIDKKIIKVDKYGFESDDILIFVGIISALITFLTYLSDYDKRIKKLKTTLYQRLHLPYDEGLRSFENIHLLPAKKLLIEKVKKSCEQILDNELIATIKSSDLGNRPTYIVKTNHHFYENFGNLKKKERSTVTTDSLDLRKKISGLVITGEPGNGKTFGLARWISDLVKTITDDIKTKDTIESKIPVFISLNNWNSTELTGELFEDWLVEAIIKQYDGLDVKIIKYLVQQHEIIPCTDGLDEVADEYRFSCLKSIVKYAGIKNSLAFSCRKLVFQDLLERENFDIYNNIAVFELQTLTEDKIIHTIRGAKQNAEELIQFLHNNKTLINYINTPLFLNLYMLTFDVLTNENKQKIKESKNQSTFEYIMWEKYDDLMMQEKVLKNGKSDFRQWPERIRTYMVVLSKNIQGNMFFIEQVQPAWLTTSFRIFLYYFTSRLLSGLILSIAIGLFVATVFSFIGTGILASLTVTLLTLWMNYSKEKKTFIHQIYPPVLFTGLLVIVTSLYQGFSVIRSRQDMRFGNTFSVTEALSGILVGLFFGVIFGVRKLRQDKKSDIQPVQLFYFNWRKSLVSGTAGGIGIGLFIGLAAILIKYFLPATTFAGWLKIITVEIIHSCQKLMHFSPSIVVEYIFTFSLGIGLGFILGFIISALLRGLDRERMDLELSKTLELEADSYFKNNNEKYTSNISLNNGIRQSLFNSLRYGLIACVILTVVHSLLLFLYNSLLGRLPEPKNFIRALKVGIGSGIISFLWFGGFEVIQHYCLRMYLYFFGIIPLQFDRWVKKIIDLAFMRKVGAGLQFYHPKIKDYFGMIPLKGAERLTDTSSKKLSRMFHLLFCVVMFTLLVMPIYDRSHKYWKPPFDFLTSTSGNLVSNIKPNKFIIQKTGQLELAIEGKINIGTFSGFIGPEGTEVGLLGFPITDIYDVIPQFRHGQLLYKINNVQNWQPIYDTIVYFIPWKTRVVNFHVKRGDTLYFKLNDRELENNSGHFNLVFHITSDSSRNHL